MIFKLIRWITLSLFAFIATISGASERILLTEAEQAFLQKHPVIRVSNEADFPPFDFAIGGEPRGYSIDLLNLLADRIGIELEFVNGYSWAELVEQFKAGDLDLIHTLNRTPERIQFGLFTSPFMRYKNYFVTHRDNPEITRVEELYGKSFAVVDGWSIKTYIEQNHPQISLQVYGSQEEMLEAVDDQRAYAMIGDHFATQYVINKKGFRDLKFSGWFREFDNGTSRSYRFMAQLDAPELISMLNKALDALTFQEMDALEIKWFGESLQGLGQSDNQIQYTADELSYLEQKGEIRMCVDPNWAPFESLGAGGEYQGLAADILALVSQRANLELVPVPTQSWTQSIEFAKTRRCDIFSLAMSTPERRTYMDFTPPYVSFPFVIATLDSSIFIDSIEQVRDQKLAIVKGYAYAEFLREDYPDIDLVEVESINQGLRLVQDEEVFGMIDALPTIAYAIQQGGYTRVKVAGRFDYDWELGVATRNDEPLLNAIMTKAMATVSTKERAGIYNRWYAVRLESHIDYAQLLKIVLAGILLLAMFVIWNRQVVFARRKTEAALAKLKLVHEELEMKNRALEQLAVRDHLTGLYNRIKLEEALVDETARCRRYGHPLGLIMLDVDHFKQVNDTDGHQMGDKVLQLIAQSLLGGVREVDLIGRWGGEEFLVICPETDLQGTLALAEHLRGLVAGQDFPASSGQTISLGVTELHHKDKVQEIVGRADKALYQAKDRGRNRVEFNVI